MEAIATMKIEDAPFDGLAAGAEREGLLRAVERLEAAMAALERALWDDERDGYAPEGSGGTGAPDAGAAPSR